MRTISVSLNQEEEALFKEYAKSHDIPLSMLFKRALEQQIEDELDLKMIREIETSPEFHTQKYVSHDKVKSILGLTDLS